MFNAVGINVSIGKSTVAVPQPSGVIIRNPFDTSHTSQALGEFSKYLGSLVGIASVFRYGQYTYPVKNFKFTIQLLHEAKGCCKNQPDCTAG